MRAGLPPHLWRSLADDLTSFPRHIRERGIAYAGEGRVGPLQIVEDQVAAVVRGTSDYEVSWEWDGQLWLPDCTCPVGPYCKHAYALACCLLDRARGEAGFDDRRLARLLPAHVPPPRSGPAAIPGIGEVVRRRRGPAPAAPRLRRAHAPAPPPRRPAAADVDDLRVAPSLWGRSLALQRLLDERPDLELDLSAAPFPAALAEGDADLRCWRLARELPRLTGGWLPAALEPWRDRPDLAEWDRERALPLVEHELREWARRRVGVPSRRLRAVLGLTHAYGEPGVTLLVCVSSSRAHDQPRTGHQLLQMQAALRRQPGMLEGAQAALLDALIEAGRVDGAPALGMRPAVWPNGAIARLLRRVGESPHVTWDRDLPTELARPAAVVPGAAVRISPLPLRLLPACVAGAGEPRIELRLVWPDGSERALADALHLRALDAYGEPDRGLVLADGVFHELAEEPSRELLEIFREHGPIAVRGAARGELLATLAEGFPSVRASLLPHTLHHPVAPAVTLRLRGDDWLQIRVLAHTAGAAWRPGEPLVPPALLYEFAPEGRWDRWSGVPVRSGRDTFEAIAGAAAGEDVAAAPGAALDPAAERVASGAEPAGAAASPPADEVWLEAPDPARVAPVLEWLAATQARPGAKRGPGGQAPAAAEAHVGWWVRLGARTVEALADAWERRPAGVGWFGDAEVRRLLGRTPARGPRVSVRSSGIDWLTVALEWEAESGVLSEEDLARLRGASTRWVKLASGWARRESVEAHDRTAAVLADLGMEPGEGEQRLTLWHLAHARPESLAELERLGAGPGAVEALQRLRAAVEAFEGVPHCPVPVGFVGELRPYQQRGLDFLAFTATLGLGVVLADDMGLGKTIQALAWVQHLRARDPGLGPCLVVCPTSVLHNWVREAERFVPGMRVLALESGSARHARRRGLEAYDLLVTSYALLRRDLEQWKQAELGAVILDEAQNIKNPGTSVARATLELKPRHRLALTGTPLENRALDLWSIMHFVNPGYLGGRTRFTQRFDVPDAPPHVRALLGARLRPVLLRRLKSAVAPDLPERIEERRDCEMTRGQRQLYVAELQRSRALLARLTVEPAGVERNQITILAALTRLRQICCHPLLAGGREGLGSGKFDALFELLEPLLAEGHKVLVFSQFVECLKLLAAAMDAHGVAYHMLTGSTLHRERVVAGFQQDPRACAFLVSLKAGGTGLNLTAASYVVLFDPWWNPAVEAQAIDRSHRIGQDRTVIAYRMLMQGTIEERIWELQRQKAALVQDVLGEDGFARALDREALEYLLAEA